MSGHALMVYGDDAIRVEGSPRSVALALEDARRQGDPQFYLRVNGVPVLFNAELPWEITGETP